MTDHGALAQLPGWLRPWAVAGLFILVLAAIIGALALLWRGGPPSGSLEFLTVAVVAIAGLGLLAAALKSIGLGSHPEALGLPPGSIRALLSLGLLITLFLFTTQQMDTLLGSNAIPLPNTVVADAQVERVISDFARRNVEAYPISSGGGSTTLSLFAQRNNDDAVDVIKTIVNGLLTLVAAVVSFYFGTRSGEARTETSSGVDASGANSAITELQRQAAPIMERLNGFRAEVSRLAPHRTRLQAADQQQLEAVERTLVGVGPTLSQEITAAAADLQSGDLAVKMRAITQAAALAMRVGEARRVADALTEQQLASLRAVTVPA